MNETLNRTNFRPVLSERRLSLRGRLTIIGATSKDDGFKKKLRHFKKLKKTDCRIFVPCNGRFRCKVFPCFCKWGDLHVFSQKGKKVTPFDLSRNWLARVNAVLSWLDVLLLSTFLSALFTGTSYVWLVGNESFL